MTEPVAALLFEALERAREGGALLGPVPAVRLEVPRDEEHGDLATNVALLLAATEKRPAQAVAETILEHLQDPDGLLEAAWVAGPGFLNFRFRPAFWHRCLREAAAAGAGYGRSTQGSGRRVLVEFVSANPTGPLTAAHGRGAAVGDAIARLLEATGHDVQREYYVNDTGHQMALLGSSVLARYAARVGVKMPSPEDGYQGGYVDDLAEQMLEAEGCGVLEVGMDEAAVRSATFAGRVLLEDIRGLLERFAVRFDRFQSERALQDEGVVGTVLAELERRGQLYEQDGARWFRASAFGDDKDRTVVKSGGELTYFASDVGYHWHKFRRGFHQLIDLFGADHHGYVERVRAALRALGLPAEELRVVLVQMVHLTRGGVRIRMGKRSGEFVTLRELVDEVGPDAARFFFLMRKADAHLDFDIELAKRQNADNPVYYVQYAHARIASIFGQAAAAGAALPASGAVDLTRLCLPEEMGLVRSIARFPDVVRESADALEPHRVVFYLIDLAGAFHRYYNQHRVLTEDSGLTAARLFLVSVVQGVVRQGLGLAGVSAPERM